MADKTHPKMQRAERAKQFMPFDALKGFREALAEKERVTVPKKEFSEEYSAGLDGRLRRIRRKDFVTAEYYKDGEYVRVTGEVTGISAGEQVLVVGDERIPFRDLSDLWGADCNCPAGQKEKRIQS